jgi:putative ABC transport system permease protein
MVNGVIASLWMLLAFGAFIAAMGLINTLSMNILEQTREIGMLRVVAMTRSQVRRMILTQALLLGVIGLLPGLLAGVFVEYAIGLSSWAVLGHVIAFKFRPELFFGCLAASIGIVLLSSWIPAERAARL